MSFIRLSTVASSCKTLNGGFTRLCKMRTNSFTSVELMSRRFEKKQCFASARFYTTENKENTEEIPARFKNTSASDISLNFPTVAVLLSGNGYLDGSDCLETSALTFQLYNYGIRPVFYAPTHTEVGLVYNHNTKGSDSNEERWAHKESARISRTITSLSELNSEEHLALFIPGGDGAIMTLSDIYTSHEDLDWGRVNEDAENAVKSFFNAQKPIISLGNAGVFVAQILGTKRNGPGVIVTTGREHGDWIKKCGSYFEDAQDIVIDAENKIISCGGVSDSRVGQSPDIVFDRCGEMIETLKIKFLPNADIKQNKYLELKQGGSSNKS